MKEKDDSKRSEDVERTQAVATYSQEGKFFCSLGAGYSWSSIFTVDNMVLTLSAHTAVVMAHPKRRERHRMRSGLHEL